MKIKYMRHLLLAGVALVWTGVPGALQAEPLSLSTAMIRAASADPAREAAQQRKAASDAGVRQAGVRPNPSIGLEMENMLGSNPYSGIDQVETTLSYEHTLERGGKRLARIGAASAERDVTVAQGRLRAYGVMSEVQTLWVEATVAASEVDLARERLTLARQAQSEIGRRVSAARDPLFAGSLADADVTRAQIALDQAEAKSRQARAQLAAYWGGAADFEMDIGWLGDTSAARLVPVIRDTPELEVMRAQTRVASAQVRVESTRTTQDMTLQVGVRHYRADGAVAFLVGGSIPLGIYDTNRGNIERAQAESAATAADITVWEQKRARDIAASTARMQGYAEEVRRIDAELIPQAERAVTQVRAGFARGGFTYRDVMGAQEVLIAAKARRLEVLKNYHLERTQRDRLTGQWVPLIASVVTDGVGDIAGDAQ
ncbi:MAG: TolC family protein [Asticcacaulis sp.]